MEKKSTLKNPTREDINGALSLIYFFNNPRIFPSQAALASTTNMDMDGGIASESIRVIPSEEYRRVPRGVKFSQQDNPAVIPSHNFFIIGQPKDTDIVLRDITGQLWKFVYPKKENPRWNDWQWVHDLNYWRYARIWKQYYKKTK